MVWDRNAYRRKKTAEFQEFKKTLKCADCGTDDHRVLQFHHRNSADIRRLPGGGKVMLATLVRTGNEKQWREYVQICDVLCANCHVIRHYEERQ